MKHNKLYTLLAAVLTSVSAITSFPGTVAHAIRVGGDTADGLHYVVDTDTEEVSITRYKGTSTEVKIPDTIEGYPVTTIDWYAFRETAVTSVTVPASVTLIESRAFQFCNSLNSLTILGPAKLKNRAVANCTNLKSVWLSEDSGAHTDNSDSAFINCPKLDTINGQIPLMHQTDNDGVVYPVFNPAIETVLLNHFKSSDNIKFINDYCTEFCNYIVKTETSYDPDSKEQQNDWMNDALKARQLHDWLVRHCRYEDSNNGESIYDPDNHTASSAFFSYAINERGEDGIQMGETVCEGFSKAYTMLLSAAKIESYIVGIDNIHVWNMLKIDDEFYHVDVTNDAGTYYKNKKDWNPYGTYYGLFLVSDLGDGTELFRYSDHPLLTVYTDNVSSAIANCLHSYHDENRDGILDMDFDLDGVDYSHDYTDDNNALQGFLRFAYGFNSTPEQINDRLPEVLAELHALKKGYWDYVNDAAPVSASVPNGGTAEFKVTLFGENLYYQWFLYVEKYNRWDFIENANGISPTLYWNANEDTNGSQFVCRIMNQDGYCLYSAPVTLTVT